MALNVDSYCMVWQLSKVYRCKSTEKKLFHLVFFHFVFLPVIVLFGLMHP